MNDYDDERINNLHWQVESALAVQALKPRVDLIKARFGDDKEKITKETNILYEQERTAMLPFPSLFRHGLPCTYVWVATFADKG